METIVEDWLAAQLSGGTRTLYRYCIGEFLRWAESAGVDPLTARRADMDRYRNYLSGSDRPGGKLADSTIAGRLSVVASFYRYAVDEGALEHSPMERVKRPKVSNESQQHGLTAAQARMLLAAAIQAGPHVAALVHVLLLTGMRVSEACGALVTDLRTVAGERRLRVKRKGGKIDEVLLPPDCWEVLDGYLRGRPEGRSGHLLRGERGQVLSRHNGYQIVSALAAPVAPGERIGPHSLRHTAATLLLDAGRPLQEVQVMLGHANPATTLRYDRARTGRGRAAGRALGELLQAGE